MVETRAGGRLQKIFLGLTSVKYPVVISEGVLRKSEVHWTGPARYRQPGGAERRVVGTSIEMAVVMVTSNQVGGLSKSGNGAFSFVKVVFCCDVHNAALPSRRCRCAPLYYAQAHDRPHPQRMRSVKRRILDGSHCYHGYQESVEERQSFKLSVDDGQFVCIILLKMSKSTILIDLWQYFWLASTFD